MDSDKHNEDRPDAPGADPPQNTESGSAGLSPDQPATADSLFGILGQKFRAGKTTKTIVYHFCIDDRDWTLVVSSEAFQVLDGKPATPDCYLKTTSEIIIGTVRGEYKLSFADFLSGKIRSNNPQLLLTLREVFSGE